MNKRIAIGAAVAVLILILGVALGFAIVKNGGGSEVVVPDPGSIHIRVPVMDSDRTHEVLIEYEETEISVTSKLVNSTSQEVLSSQEVQRNRTEGDAIWESIMRPLLEEKGNDPPYDCGCLVDKDMTMVDSEGNVVVEGMFNDHKFFVQVEGVKSRIWTGSGPLDRGFDMLMTLYSETTEGLEQEYIDSWLFLFETEEEPALQYDDDVYYSVGGGVTGPHFLNVSGFKNESFSGDVWAAYVHLVFKTDDGFSNDNTMKVLYRGDVLDTGFSFGYTSGEVEKIIDLSDVLNVSSLDVFDISLIYNNHGGLLSTPMIFFDRIWIRIETERV